MEEALSVEADVREDVTAPFLRYLGYRKGTSNNIWRERPLKYDRIFLGHKKSNDPPLRGKADYVLSVLGVARWVLETKPPTAIAVNDIDQAISYARHPEVAGKYIVICNGLKLLIFSDTQTSNDSPIVDIDVTTPEDLAQKLENILSPEAIARDFRPLVIDLNKPIAKGFRSKVSVTTGYSINKVFTWDCDPLMKPFVTERFDEMRRFMIGRRNTIVGGVVWRDEQSRIRAKLEWDAPNNEVLQFMNDKKLMDAEYVALSEKISSDSKKQTIFDAVGGLNIEEGESLFDSIKWQSVVADIAVNMNYRAQVVGFIDGDKFKGEAQTEYTITYTADPDAQISIFAVSEFEVGLSKG